MASPTSGFTQDDRRAHPRREVRHPVTLNTPDADPIACESVDVSVGGMRIRTSARVSLGPCEVVVSADGDDDLALRGDVVEEIIDASTGHITARIVFRPAPVTALERVVALPDRTVVTPARSRRRGGLLLAAGIAAGLVIAAAVASSDDRESGNARPRAASASVPGSRPAPVDAQPRVPAASARPAVQDVVTTGPAPVPAPIGTTAPAPGSASASPPAAAPDPSPAPTSAAHVERADNTVLVELGSSAEETSVTSTMGPSAEGEVIRMQLHVTPEPDGTALPIAVTLENRGEETATFEGGFEAIVTASRDGASAATTTLTSTAVTQLAPGEVVTVEGVLDFGAIGTYDVTASVEVS